MKQVWILTLAVLAASCQFKTKSNDIEFVDANHFKQVTVYGTILDASITTITLLEETTGDTLTFNTVGAEKQGTIRVGDKAEVSYEDTDENLQSDEPNVFQVFVSPDPARLIGEWVEPTIMGDLPYEGIKLEEGGVASTINQETVVYESWQLVKGRLALKSTSMTGGNNITSVDTFDIQLLTPDSIVLVNKDFEMHYCRLRPGMQQITIPENREIEELEF